MAKKRIIESRQAIAERNVQAILDAAERLLARGAQLNVSAVAAEAELSRPTVYAHFGDRQQLLAALVERAARQAMVAIESAEPDGGPSVEALRRVIGASWEHLARHQEIARAAIAEISPDTLHAAHDEVVSILRRLVERGRDEGVFRTDLPTAWQATSCLALMHAAAAAVRSGQMDPDSARDALVTSVEDICLARKAPRPSSRARRDRRDGARPDRLEL